MRRSTHTVDEYAQLQADRSRQDYVVLYNGTERIWVSRAKYEQRPELFKGYSLAVIYRPRGL